MTELVGNKAIEDAAVKWVMELESAAGRQPQDTRYKRTAAGIESPPRVIEVKAFGTSNRGYDLWPETRQVDVARKNPDFPVYVVENVRQGDPELFTVRVVGGTRLQDLLTHAKEQHGQGMAEASAAVRQTQHPRYRTARQAGRRRA